MQAPSDLDPTLPRACPVTLESLEIGGKTLREAHLGGFAYGPALGTAPVYVIVGGITAQPYPFGDGRSTGWWPALGVPDLIDLRRHTVLCPAWPAKDRLMEPSGRPACP